MNNFDTDDKAVIVFLILLLLVVGGSMIIGSRKNINSTLQQMAVWALIFLGAVGAYSVKDKIEAQLFPSEPQIMNRGTVAFNRARDGHFYARLRINDAMIEFVIDTGATNIVMNQRDAVRAGIDMDRIVYSGLASTANGYVRTARIRLDQVKLGRFVDRNISASVNEGDLETSLLGMRYLGLFSKIEIAGNRMTLTR